VYHRGHFFCRLFRFRLPQLFLRLCFSRCFWLSLLLRRRFFEFGRERFSLIEKIPEFDHRRRFFLGRYLLEVLYCLVDRLDGVQAEIAEDLTRLVGAHDDEEDGDLLQAREAVVGWGHDVCVSGLIALLGGQEDVEAGARAVEVEIDQLVGRGTEYAADRVMRVGGDYLVIGGQERTEFIHVGEGLLRRRRELDSYRRTVFGKGLRAQRIRIPEPAQYIQSVRLSGSIRSDRKSAITAI
jgi:hypothetical protein